MMSPEIPEWINSEYLRQILEENLKQEVKVTNFTVRLAVGKGENFMSTLYKVRFIAEDKKGNSKNMNLIVKAFPHKEYVIEIANKFGTFPRETYMYETVLPEMYTIWKERAPHIHFTEFGCNYFKNVKEPSLILEDITSHGYEMANRHNRLDFDHCELVIRNIAKFHATGIILLEQHPEFEINLQDNIFSNKNDDFKERAEAMIGNIANVVEKWENYERFGPKIRNYATKVQDVLHNVTSRDSCLGKNLNHGDSWMNNMMFKYSDDRRPIALKFVDYQISKMASPLWDFIYFLSSSGQEEVVVENEYDLLEVYYETINENLVTLGHEPVKYSLSELKSEYKAMELFSFHMSIVFLTIVMSDPEDALDIESLGNADKGEASFKKACSGQRYKDACIKVLLRFEKQGVI